MFNEESLYNIISIRYRMQIEVILFEIGESI
jgi:hypothetical protein